MLGLKVNIGKINLLQLGVKGDKRMARIVDEKIEQTGIFVLLGIQFDAKELQNIANINCNSKFPKIKRKH